MQSYQNTLSGLNVSFNPSETLNIILKQGEVATGSISVTNTNEQKIIVKLRSNAGKNIRIKNSIFILDSNQTISLEVKIPLKAIEELFQKYEESKSFPSYRIQFNIAGISDVLFDHLQSVEQDQEKYLSNQWSSIVKTEIQQYQIVVNFSSDITSSLVDDRKSEDNLSQFTVTDISLSPEYKQLQTRYEALCVVVKRCQDIIRKQKEEATEMGKKLEKAEATAKLEKEVEKVIPDSVLSTVKPSTLTGISVFAFILTFVIGFVLGQFASRFMK